MPRIGVVKNRPRLVGAVLCIGIVGCGAPSDERLPEVDPTTESLEPEAIWREGPRLPAPVANNAVAALRSPVGISVVSFLGIDSTKAWSGVTTAAYRWDFGGDEGWREIEPVPGPGRLAPTVQTMAGRVFVFGGYTVAEDGSEESTPYVNVYNVATDSWGRAADIPLPVDDAVSGVYASSFIYLVSGWHDTGNVPDVQLFDPTINVWRTATPIPGEPVFGHSGAIAGDDIVYVGGAKVVDARPRFVVDSAAWRGRIDPEDPTVIEWEEIENPPGRPLYRAAAAGLRRQVVLAGGSANPYNYDGIGYDGEPSAPEHQLLAFDPEAGWVELLSPPVPTMDHRTLGVAGGYVFLVGGMEEGQRVSDRVWYAEVDALLDAAGLR